MHAFKWWLVLELFAGALLADVTGHSNIAIMVAIVATAALLVALELGVDLELDAEHGLTLERLALVIVYARQHRNATGEPAGWWWLNYCRRLARGLDRW